MTATNKNILKTIAYFDVFSYPLTIDEIWKFHPEVISKQEIESAVKSLCTSGSLFRHQNFYSIHNREDLAVRRLAGNEMAGRLMVTAVLSAKKTAGFPFVSALLLSGSLSKNYADENSDIDFFIITKPNRLWIARTFLQLFYKLQYFTGRQKNFCFNYYIDEEALQITEQNIFTAAELATAMPMYGSRVSNLFFEKNKWITLFLPQAAIVKQSIPDYKKNWVSHFWEWVFSGAMGNRLDNLLMSITKKRWQKKERKNKKTTSGKRLALMADKHFAKPNPQYYQQQVLQMANSKFSEFNPVSFEG